MDAIGADAATDIHEVANVDSADFAVALEAWRIGEPSQGDGGPEPRPASAIDKGRARAFHKSCRIAAKLEWSKVDTEEWEWQSVQRQSLAQAERTAAISMAATTVPQPAKLARSVKISEVADVTKAV